MMISAVKYNMKESVFFSFWVYNNVEKIWMREINEKFGIGMSDSMSVIVIPLEN